MNNTVKINGKAVTAYDSIPDGWKPLIGAQTAPIGYEWYFNGKSRFINEYKSALVKFEWGKGGWRPSRAEM